MVTPCLWNGKPAAVAFSNSEVAFASSGVMGNFAAGGFKDSPPSRSWAAVRCSRPRLPPEISTYETYDCLAAHPNATA